MDNVISIKQERNYGIDFLRIVSMIMVLVLHILGHGWVLDNGNNIKFNNYMAWFLEIACYGATNIFGIISGYVGYKSKHKYANILYLNLQVTLILLVTITVYKLRYPEFVKLDDFKKASMPFAYYVLWYYRAYFCMFFFIPFMNMAVSKMSRNEGRLMIFSIFFIFTMIPTFFNNDAYDTNYGYSALWLSMMYLTGAYLAKFKVSDKYKWWKLLLIYFICVLVTFGWKYQPLEFYFFKDLINYSSPTVYIYSIALVLLFAKFKFHKVPKHVIKFFTPLAFGVYVIHVSPYFWDKFMDNRFKTLGGINPFVFPFAVIGIAILLFICFALMDYVRYLLFKLCRVKKFFTFLENKIRKLCSKIFKEDSNELATDSTLVVENNNINEELGSQVESENIENSLRE